MLKYSATTVFLPHLDLEETCAALARFGYDGVELRVRRYTGDPNAEPSPWGRHKSDISPDTVLRHAEEIKSALAACRLAPAAFASNAAATESDDIRKLAEGAAAVGCPLIKVGAPRPYDRKVNYFTFYEEAVRAYEKTLKITRPYKVRCIIETHLGTIFVSASLAHRLAANFDPADIGILYDPQNNVADGFETIPIALDLMGPYLAHIHAGGHKCVAGTPDADGTTPWTYPPCRLGEGRYNYAELLAELARRDYRGFVSVEDFDATRPPEQRLEDAMRYLRKIVR